MKVMSDNIEEVLIPSSLGSCANKLERERKWCVLYAGVGTRNGACSTHLSTFEVPMAMCILSPMEALISLMYVIRLK